MQDLGQQSTAHLFCSPEVLSPSPAPAAAPRAMLGWLCPLEALAKLIFGRAGGRKLLLPSLRAVPLMWAGRDVAASRERESRADNYRAFLSLQ